MSITFETGALFLGYVGTVASWRRTPPSDKAGMRRQPMLVISVCADIDEGVYTPATSIAIDTVVGLRALRAAIDEALKYERKENDVDLREQLRQALSAAISDCVHNDASFGSCADAATEAVMKVLAKQEPVAEWIENKFDQYPQLVWDEKYKAVVGTKLYVLPGAKGE